MVSYKDFESIDSYQLLERIIEKEIAYLRIYANKTDAKQSFLDIKNDHIRQLTEVLNLMKLKELKFKEIWHMVEVKLANAHEIDPYINGFILIVKTPESKSNPLLLSYYLGGNNV